MIALHKFFIYAGIYAFVIALPGPITAAALAIAVG